MNPYQTTTRAPRVLLLLDTRAWAGTESHVLTLARALNALNDGQSARVIEVSLAVAPNSPLWKRAANGGLPRVPIARRGEWDLATLGVLVRRLKRGATDVIHVHNGRTALWGALAVSLAGRGACVATHHFIEPAHAGRSGPKAAVSSAVHRWIELHIQGHIAISRAVAEAVEERGVLQHSQITIVPNGIDLAPDVSGSAAHANGSSANASGGSTSTSEGSTGTIGGSTRTSEGSTGTIGTLTPVSGTSAETNGSSANASAGAADQLPPELRGEVVCVARLQKEKDVPTLVRAMARLNAHRSVPVRCVVAGEGQERAAIEEVIAREKGCNVVLAGFTRHAAQMLRGARVATLPSVAEPFGLALLEAMAQGKPVVAVGQGGPAEIVVDGETGLLVPPSDPDALARALGDLLDDPKRAAAMGEAGYKRLHALYGSHRMATRTLNVYRAALNAGEPKA